MKIGRNQPCPCGSGRKYKRCCGDRSNNDAPLPPYFSASASRFLERHKADELIRQQQQGLGRPIIAIKFKDQQLVAAGNTLYFSPKWKTFPDFLPGYLGAVLGKEWGNAEIAKPLAERHLVVQWYQEYCHLQGQHLHDEPGEIKSMPMKGVVCCYLGLAYGLYLLKHNVDLQERLVKRLKDMKQFQGAYYEVIVANSLIRAGFELTLEDETDEASKHCEFAAVSKKTGKKYWVEAKMRGVAGMLGKTEVDGTSNSDPTCMLSSHLSAALKKPADDERLIFIDVNTDPQTDKAMPPWMNMANRRLDARERDLKPGESAYVFITNLSFHRALQSEKIGCAIIPYGLGISDFNKPGAYRISEIYRRKQRHIDAYDIAEALGKYPQLPTTFDGGLPSSLNGKSYERIIIGETYAFKGKNDEDIVATVTTVNVDEKERVALIGTSTGHIFKHPMSDDEFNDYRSHPEAFWGNIQPPQKQVSSRYELFEWLLDSFKNTPKAQLLEAMKDAPDFSTLQQMDQADLAIEHAERLCWSEMIKFPGQ
ncbi:MAG: SEC-C metal-binding domain-containing protein [Syntrophobacteraceae bacterium]